jgi:antitoxin Phd
MHEMAAATWTLQDAMNQFSRVVTAAEKGAPQVVTKRGRSAVVVLSYDAYERLVDAGTEPPKDFVEHLLSIPKRPPTIPDEEELFPREPFTGREFDFEA